MEAASIEQIRILDETKFQTCVKAFVDIRLPNGMLIRDCRILEKEDKSWMNFPMSYWTDRETGEIRYKRLIKMPLEQREAVEVSIIESWKRIQEKRPANVGAAQVKSDNLKGS